VSETELIERNDGTIVVSDLGETDLGEGKREERK
jgi:hypothetical protein